MAGLPQSGVELVAQGASAYVGDIGRAASATDQFTGSLDKAGSGASAFSQIAVGALRHVGAIAVEALGQAAQAAGKFLADSVTSAADVEQIINVLGATSGATAGELEAVRAAAIALGGDLSLPATSAQDAAEAMLELSKAGFSVDEAMAAAKGTLQLAAAAQVSAGEAAAISAQAINAFGLEAADAGRVADLLAGGANASSASMTDLAQGLQQGGFAFHQAGQSIEDLTTSLAALTNVGLTGSDAGTALKNAMMRLMNPTEKAAALMAELGFSAYDAQGNMKPLETIIAELNTAMAGMTNEQRDAALGTIFLSDGMKAMTPLLNLGADGFAKLRDEVTKAGSAQSVAGAQTQGFNGAIAGLQSQMETLQLIIGSKVLPILTPLIQQFSAVASAVSEVVMSLFDAGAGSSEFYESLGLLNEALGLAPGTLEGLYAAGVQVATMLQQGGAEAQRLGQAFVEWVTPYATQLADTFRNQIIPAAMEVWTVFTTQIMPILSDLGTALLPLVSGAIEILASYWTNVLVPALTAAWTFFRDSILPVLADVATWLKDNLPGAIQATTDFVTKTLLPGLKDLGAFVVDVLIPGLVDLIAKGLKATQDAATALSDYWTGTLQPGLEAVSELVGGALKSAWEDIQPVLNKASEIAGSVASGFRGIASAIGAAIEKVKAFIEAASKIKVPSLVTPGSPTPFEIGLRGIADAANQAGAALATSFAASLGKIGEQPALATIATTTAPARAAIGGGSTTVNNARTLNYSPSYGSAVRPSPTMDAAVARSLAL